MIRSMLIYGLGAAASRLVAVFLVPLYTRTLSVEAYGQLELLLALHTAAVLIAGLQSESALLRDFYAAREQGALPQLRWAAVFITLAGTCGLIALFALAALGGWVDPVVSAHGPLLLAVTLAAQLFGLQQVLLRFGGSAVRFAFVSFLDLALSALASVLFLIVFDWGIAGALAGILVGKMTASLLVWARTFGRWPSPLPARPLFRGMLAYALPTMPSVLFNWLQTNGTRALLAVFLTFQAVAVAGVAMRVAALFGFAVYSFRLAWEPYAFRMIEDRARSPDAFNRVLEWYMVVFFVAAGAAILIGPLLVSIFAPPQYSGSIALVGTFILGQFWLGVANITVVGIHGARRTSKLTHVFGVGAGVNVGVLAALSPVMGVSAAAIGFLASTIVSGTVANVYSERYFAAGFSNRLLVVAALASAVCAAASLVIYDVVGPAGRSWELQTASFAGVLLGAVAFLVFVGIPRTRRIAMARSLSAELRDAARRKAGLGPSS